MSDPTTNELDPAAADRARELADGILDRPAGEQYNPESPEVVAEHRARFDAANERLLHSHEQLEQTIVPVMQRVKAEADAATQQPEHQAMIEHQLDHEEADPKAHTAGKERHNVLNNNSDHLVQDLHNPRPGDTDGPIVPVRNDSLRKDR